MSVDVNVNSEANTCKLNKSSFLFFKAAIFLFVTLIYRNIKVNITTKLLLKIDSLYVLFSLLFNKHFLSLLVIYIDRSKLPIYTTVATF